MNHEHIAEVLLNEQGTLKVSLDVSDGKFYKCSPMRLVKMRLLERDDSYMSEDDLAAGMTGWMSCGTHYFLPEQLEYAKTQMPDPKTFDYDKWRNKTKGLIHLDDLPRPDGFDYTRPFVTRSGWSARLLGVLNRPSFPLVVAVSNPAFSDCEQVCFYNLDGRTPTEVTHANSLGVKDLILLGAQDGALSLINKEKS